MQIVLAWTLYLVLGVACLVLGWGLLAPRLPRRVRLAILAGAAALAVIALGVTSQIPHDYQTLDVAEYTRGFIIVNGEMLVALAGLTAGLLAVGRRRVQNAALFGAGVYLAGTGLVMYILLNGEANMQAAALVFVGSSLAMAAALRLVGQPRWVARLLGPAAGLAVALGAEALRGMGSRGDGPAAASRDVLALAAIASALLLLGGYFFARSQGRVLVRPLGWAAAGIAATGLLMALRGPGEWAPGPLSGSTTLYGLPLTVLALAIGLAIAEVPGERRRTTDDGRRASGNPQLSNRNHQRASLIGRRWSVVGRRSAFAVLAPFIVLAALWRPAADPCAVASYADSSPLTPAGAAWAISPGPAAPRGSPDLAEFDKLCTYSISGPGQIVYAIDQGCKWAQIDGNYPLVQASGVLSSIVLSSADSPWLHTSHDLGLDMAVDPASAWLVFGNQGHEPQAGAALLHVEAESGHFPVAYRPVAGDRLTVAGRWIFDCGHEPKTEIHPAAVLASEHEAWRSDVAGAAGAPHLVHVLQVWMNGAPGVVHVPLAPFNVQAGFPTAPSVQVATPFVQVVTGDPAAVSWTIDTSAGPPQAAVHVMPPAAGSSSYFELLLGYREASPLPASGPPVTYTVTLDSLDVHDDLHLAARNTTGLPYGLAYPGLGFAGSGHWTMQMVVDHTWLSLLDNAAVASGHIYPLSGAVPPVKLLAPGDQHLNMAVTGYAENDPSDGVELASGTVDYPPVINWDAGTLAALCCDTPHTFTPQHGAWTVTYHVSRP
jgi:hypothetical protein